jgi:hypothetical protein
MGCLDQYRLPVFNFVKCFRISAVDLSPSSIGFGLDSCSSIDSPIAVLVSIGNVTSGLTTILLV